MNQEETYYAYLYLQEISQESKENARINACRNPYRAYYYAKDIDKEPKEITRIAACEDPAFAY